MPASPYTFAFLVLLICSSMGRTDEATSRTVKKELIAPPPNETMKEAVKPSNNPLPSKTHRTEQDEIPNSVRVGFYVFIALGLGSIFFFTYRSYRLRSSRAERRYGVQGDRTTQELTPLPIAMEEDSENEDQTVFDINKQTRVS